MSLDKAAAGKGNGNPADVLLTLLDNLGLYRQLYGMYGADQWVYIRLPLRMIKPRSAHRLMSRFAVIDIPDYTAEEKKVIFSRFALPKVHEAHEHETRRVCPDSRWSTGYGH